MTEKKIAHDALFALGDSHHDFGMKLSCLLRCIRIAQDRGAIPTIDQGWWDSFVVEYSLSGDASHGLPIATLASPQLIDHTDCEDCLENWLFEMNDETGSFVIGLKTMLTCLAFAQHRGVVPELDAQWWNTIRCCF